MHHHHIYPSGPPRPHFNKIAADLTRARFHYYLTLPDNRWEKRMLVECLDKLAEDQEKRTSAAKHVTMALALASLVEASQNQELRNSMIVTPAVFGSRPSARKLNTSSRVPPPPKNPDHDPLGASGEMMSALDRRRSLRERATQPNHPASS